MTMPIKDTVLKEVKEVKSLFASKTFLAVCFTAIASIAPLVGLAVKEKKLSIDNAVQIVLVLAGTGTAIVGRASANSSLVYTPDYMAGMNRSDILPAPQAEMGLAIEGTINESGVAAVEGKGSKSIDSYLDAGDLMFDAMKDKKPGE